MKMELTQIKESKIENMDMNSNFVYKDNDEMTYQIIKSSSKIKLSYDENGIIK